MKKSAALEAIDLEHGRAAGKFAAFNSAHEGFAVLYEEVDELWDEVKRRERDLEALREEAVQVGAMALRFLTDCCGDPSRPEVATDAPPTRTRFRLRGSYGGQVGGQADTCPLASDPFTCPGCGARLRPAGQSPSGDGSGGFRLRGGYGGQDSGQAATEDLEHLAEACVDYVTGIGWCPARAERARRRRRAETFRRLRAGEVLGGGL